MNLVKRDGWRVICKIGLKATISTGLILIIGYWAGVAFIKAPLSVVAYLMIIFFTFIGEVNR